ncbi:MAG TPA: TetR/AcrR family transcriptional regulator C-terminal domain-containing protein [Marmoricola sp.]|nr:TetR/AcrR family transcriptional regulator C-terminal domain-containing protein [Marmoricola sp.]
MSTDVGAGLDSSPSSFDGFSARERRTATKRSTVLAAATDLFLTLGYSRTTMEQVADRASVSKPTLYRFFADKEALFAEVVFETLDRYGTPFRATLQKLSASTDVQRDLNRVARDYIAMVTQPSVVGLRRLVIGAAAQLPHVATAYYERAPDQTLRALAEAFRTLDSRGALRVDNPSEAAAHFAMLVIGRALDKSLFCPDRPFTAAQLRTHARTGVEVFLAAYGPTPPDGRA